MPFFAYSGWGPRRVDGADRVIGRSRVDRARFDANNGITNRQSDFAARLPGACAVNSASRFGASVGYDTRLARREFAPVEERPGPDRLAEIEPDRQRRIARAILVAGSMADRDQNRDRARPRPDHRGEDAAIRRRA